MIFVRKANETKLAVSTEKTARIENVNVEYIDKDKIDFKSIEIRIKRFKPDKNGQEWYDNTKTILIKSIEDLLNLKEQTNFVSSIEELDSKSAFQKATKKLIGQEIIIDQDKNKYYFIVNINE